MYSAHPRSRGENARPRRSCSTERGSSPLTRGKHAHPHRRRRKQRLIPAHAGKTAFTPRAGPSPAAHPRSRGENLNAVAGGNADTGSSPLTRGKLPAPRGESRAGRLIPAHAGKTLWVTFPTSEWPAHPRSRGENLVLCAAVLDACGSSPLTRGKRPRYADQAVRPRLIPAHAGKTDPMSLPRLSAEAHPRSRGENELARMPRDTARGSSPLTRGKHSLTRARVIGERLIPAHAGKTRATTASARAPQAHPRSRGENDEAGKPVAADDGSSPLTRGKLAINDEAMRGHRLIPAHAGKTGPVFVVPKTCMAHPRSRGENRKVSRKNTP